MIKKNEGNIIIAIIAMKKIMTIFLGPFLTTYFIKTSQESIADLSIYYIFSYLILAISSFIVAALIKNKFKIGMFRIGVILNFAYIISIILLKENLVNHLGIISLMYGISAGAYWFPYNLFLINKIDNQDRTEYTVKSKIVSSIIAISCPVLLGSLITITNYELTALIILFVSLVQIFLSFLLTPEKESDFSKFHLIKTWKKLKNNEQIRKIYLVEFFIGMNVSDGSLGVLMTILIFNSFKTNLNLGVITSLTTILSIIALRIYGKIYKNKNDKNIIILSSVLPIITVLIMLIYQNNITLILYNICYVLFTSLLSLTRDIRLLNISNSKIVNKDNQCEFVSIRECILNLGRMFSYGLLLLVGIMNNEILMKFTLVILTLSIFITGLNISKIPKNDS